MKRFYLSLIAIVAIAAMATAGSLALFTATTTNTGNTFTSGTVTLSDVAETLVDVTNIAPGDSGSATYKVTYTGSLEAWLGLDTTFTGDLKTCDGGKFVMDVVGFNNNLANQVVGTAPFVTGQDATFNINWSLPLNAGNDCQGDSATLTMLVHAVQAKNNTTGTGPTSWGP